MILQALTHHYEVLSGQGKIAPPGWGIVKVGYALCVSGTGELEQVICLKNPKTVGKKTLMVPQDMILPAADKHDNSGTDAHFLCDNGRFLLGIHVLKGEHEEEEKEAAKSRKRFESSRDLHLNLLSGVNTPAANAVKAFFENWDCAAAPTHPLLKDCMDDLLKGANLIFRFNFSYPHSDPVIRQAWNEAYHEQSTSSEGICLVTGKSDSIEATHPVIKNVAGANPMGAALVSFNAPAFCSYGKEQNLNAPVGKYAVFAYTTALNHLLADQKHVYHMGDATVVFWAECGEDSYQDILGAYVMEDTEPLQETDLASIVEHLCQGKPVQYEDSMLDPNMKFYILGLSPNSARLSVRFFLQNSFGHFLKNVQEHHKRMEIIRPVYDKFETLPLWKLLSETVNQKARIKTPAPNLAGETLRSILSNTPYPAQLLQGVNLRIRAEHEITRGRAAIIKAYYLKRETKKIKKEEVFTVALNPDSTSIPYTLGRLFSVLEAIQASANPGINTTIKDRYFNSASATPARVFPTLINLAQKHMKKLETSWATNYDKQLTELLSKLCETYPAHLSIPEQGAFQLGYYHQTQNRYTKKNKEEN